MERFLSEIFPASIAPSSGRQFVVRAQRGAVGPESGPSGAAGSFLLFRCCCAVPSLACLTLLFLIPFFATVTADPFTHTSYVTH